MRYLVDVTTGWLAYAIIAVVLLSVSYFFKTSRPVPLIIMIILLMVNVEDSLLGSFQELVEVEVIQRRRNAPQIVLHSQIEYRRRRNKTNAR